MQVIRRAEKGDRCHPRYSPILCRQQVIPLVFFIKMLNSLWKLNYLFKLKNDESQLENDSMISLLGSFYTSFLLICSPWMKALSIRWTRVWCSIPTHIKTIASFNYWNRARESGGGLQAERKGLWSVARGSVGLGGRWIASWGGPWRPSPLLS